MADIGFLIIGAQKAGTSSLFEYMRRHPQIHIPPEKETFFFSEERVFRRGWDWYLTTMLRNAPANATCGEVSTTYMYGTNCDDAHDQMPSGSVSHSEASKRPEDLVAQRIRHFIPNVRLICLLRDPVARALSHYRMTVMERAESRSFTDAIDVLIAPEALKKARVAPTRTNAYIVNGEYSRALAGYLRAFPREQLLIIFSDELANEPEATIGRVFEFIGVAPGFVPDNLNTRYREAAVKQRIPWFDLHSWRLSLSRIGPAKALWRAQPQRTRHALDRVFYVIGYRVGLWNARRRGETGGDDDMSPDVHRMLTDHYRSDAKALGELVGREAPWRWL